MDTCPSGRQVKITYNDQRAIVVEVSGRIRHYEVGHRSIFDPYPIDTIFDAGARGSAHPLAQPLGRRALGT